MVPLQLFGAIPVKLKTETTPGKRTAILNSMTENVTLCKDTNMRNHLRLVSRHRQQTADIAHYCLRRIRSAVSATPGKSHSRVVQNRVPRQNSVKPEGTWGSGAKCTRPSRDRCQNASRSRCIVNMDVEEMERVAGIHPASNVYIHQSFTQTFRCNSDIL